MNKLFDKIRDNLISGRYMEDKEIRRIFGIPNQTLHNWKKGKSGEGKKKLYKLLRLIDAETIEEALNLDETLTADSDKKKSADQEDKKS